MIDSPDLFAATAARDQSLAQTLGHNQTWASRAINYIRLIPAGTILTGETIRERLVIAAIEPDVIVKGGDYTPDRVVGAAEVLARGGRVVIIPLSPGHSTTSTIGRLRGTTND